MIKNWIHNFLKKEAIINPDIVKDAIRDYRKEGKELMHLLGKRYGLDITVKEEYEKLVSWSNKEVSRKGELSKRWNYYFHGVECGFYNKKHQQCVEVVLSNSPEFGHINSWFLLAYMESTEKYKDKITGVDWQKLELVVEELYRSGDVEKIVK